MKVSQTPHLFCPTLTTSPLLVIEGELLQSCHPHWFCVLDKIKYSTQTVYSLGLKLVMPLPRMHYDAFFEQSTLWPVRHTMSSLWHWLEKLYIVAKNPTQWHKRFYFYINNILKGLYKVRFNCSQSINVEMSASRT